MSENLRIALGRLGMGGLMLMALFISLPEIAAAQTEPVVLHACYVPEVGAVYRIKAEGLPDACFEETHVEFAWNLQGPPGPEGPQGPAGTALAYAHVEADGTIDHDSGNVSVTNVHAGGYCIGVTGGTVHVAAASLDSRFNVGGSVQVGVFHASVCTASGDNDIYVVTRDHARDGGLPGNDKAFYIIVN